LNLKETLFIDCKLHEVDFLETNLLGSKFNNCDLKDAVFESTNLHKVDFSTAINYVINPNINNIKKAKFSMQGLAGLLTQFDIKIEG